MKNRHIIIWSFLLIAVMLLAACQSQPVEVTRVVTEVQTVVETVVEEVEITRVVEGEVVTEVQEVEVTRVVEVEAEEAALEPLPYNLTPGKPFDGTQLNFLICCPGNQQFEAWAARTAEFTELTGITVNFANEPWGSFQERIVTESIAGTGSYDVVVWLDAWGPTFQQTLLPLEPLIERDGIDYVPDDYPPAFMQAGTFNNHVYGIPVRTHAFVLFYRKDVFDELGLAAPATWDEVVEAGKTIEENTDLVGMSNYYGVGSSQNLFVWALMLWGEGGDIFDENFHPIFNDEVGIDATNRYMTLREIGQETQFVAGEGDAASLITTGESAMMITWWWWLTEFNVPENAAPEVIGNVAVAPLPAIEGKEPTGFALSIPIGISAFSRNQDAAWEFVKWLSSPEVDKAVAIDKSDPAIENVAVSHISNLSDPEVNEVNGGLHEAALPGLLKSRLMPLIPEWAEVSSILEVAINDIGLGADTQATLDEAAKDVEAVMERAGYYNE